MAGRTVLAGAVDAERLDRLVPFATGPVRAGSVALTVTGRPVAPWTVVRAGDILGSLVP